MESSSIAGTSSAIVTPMENGTGNVNGKSDRHSSHKDKYHDKDRDRHRSDKDKYRHKSSSSHKDKDRDKEKERHRDKEKEHKSSHSSRDKDRHSSSSKEKERHSSSLKDKERHSSSLKDKERHSSSSKDKDRHSISSKDKERHSSSSKDKESQSSSSREKDRHRDEDKHKASSSKDSSRSKEKQSDRGQEDTSKDRSDQNRISEEEVKVEQQDIKEEPRDSQESADESMEDSQQEDPADTQQASDDDDKPLTIREESLKREAEDDEEDTPLFARVKKLKKDSNHKSNKSKKRRRDDSDEDEDDFKPKAKQNNKKPVKTETVSPRKGKKPAEEEAPVWKWWEEKKRDDGTKWYFLEHKGPVFAPEYERLPSHVKFSYDGKEMKLSDDAEEVATFYAKMLQHDYTSKDAFNTNFMKDWRKCMNEKERAIIKDLSKCNFNKMNDYFTQKSEERKAMSKEEKLKIKEENEALQKEYGFCTIDGHKEKIGNFRIEPPGLFRGRGEHPKMGMLKRRVMPEDVMINCSKDSKVPKAPNGHKWKKVQHDNSVTWLASWIENVQGNVKYVMLNPSSKLKGEKDMLKYETARKLAKKIDQIRATYIADWKSKEMRIRQRAVALYFIDRLALRAGNEKDEDQADTVGCCSLRVEHVQLKDELNGKECVVVFDFLGKDSIRYYNEVPVEKRVYKNLKIFMENKKPGDDLFDRLNTIVLNKHLNELMDGLSAKVFRTYNASITLQNQLNELTKDDYSIPEKVLAYNRANRAVAILCNHQRSVPKSHEKSMEGLKSKIDAKRDAVDEAKKEYKSAKRNHDSAELAKAQKKLERLKEQLMKLEVQETDKEENKTIALGTSKLNYLDPRISVAWCKKHDVPIEKIYNKTQRDKFRWAIDMAGPDYVF